MVTSGLTVEGVTVSYRGGRRGSDVLPVLREASLQVSKGEVVALLGPSGCGKSTLLRAIAGLEAIDAGSVRWDGADLARVPAHARGFGVVFQDAQLFPQMSVAANVSYGLRGARWPKPVRAVRAQELLRLVGLPDAGSRAVTQLSGGERQRVALARSLAPQPRLLLLDEPLSALDRALREYLAVELAVLLRQTHTTAILVTHDEGEAHAIADRTLRLDSGRVLPT